MNCFTCWQLTYAATGKSINVLVIDHAVADTFDISLEAMNELTGGQAVTLDVVPVTYTQVATSECNS